MTKHRLRLFTYQGRARTLGSLADEAGLKVKTLWQRLRRGWTMDEAITGKRDVR